MRSILFCGLFALAACGGSAASNPAPAAPADTSGATPPSDPADAPQDDELCCCEIPSGDTIHEMMPEGACGETGYCVDADACSPEE